MTDKKRNVIIDCDPGVDDTIEILAALGASELNILGLTTASGNVSAAQTQLNARGIIVLAKADVPVFAGCEEPLSGPIDKHTADDAKQVHGESGIDGLVLPALNGGGETRHGVDFIIQTIRDAPEKSITICATGALTNIAEAFRRAPDIIERIDQIILMGGAFGHPGGNVKPHAEFNIAVDPIAANIVFSSAVNIVAIPLDITHQTAYDAEVRDRIRQMDPVFGPNIATMLDLCAAHYPDPDEEFDDEAPLHDPHTISYLVAPEIYQMQKGFVRVETNGPLTGQTSFTPDEKGNTQIPVSVDRGAFFEIITQNLKACADNAAAKPALAIPRAGAEPGLIGKQP